MAREEEIRTYDIPDNFIDESRIIKGMFKTRNFFEGLAMALVAAIPAIFIPIGTFNVKVMVVVGVCCPFFLIGNSGFNGDPISTTFIHFRHWWKERGVMLYRYDNRYLKISPLDDMMETPLPGDKIMDKLDEFKESRRKRAISNDLVEGETFEFEENEELAHLYIDEPETEKAEENEIVIKENMQEQNLESELIEGSVSPIVEVVELEKNANELVIDTDESFFVS